jgi:hypothetical protein
MARFETREEAIEAAAVTFAHICEQLSQKTPEEIAEAAHEPGGPSKEELAAIARELFAIGRPHRSRTSAA